MENKLQHALNWSVERKLQRQNKVKKLAYIYLIRCGRYVKIGVSDDPAKRVMEMQVGSPHKLRLVVSWPSLAPHKEEKRIHRLLDQYHHRGEWFRLPDLLLAKLLG